MGLGDVLILGVGASGVASARYCASLLGSEIDSLTVYDGCDDDTRRDVAGELASLGARVVLGTDFVEGSYDLCVASPGIPPHAELMKAARSASAECVSEIEFAYRMSHAPWVAITGTNGKTTTTALVEHLLSSGGVMARAVGNIGEPAIDAVNEGFAGVFVAEVSSFQLALSVEFHPRVSVLLNITPDHMDWHGSMESYVRDKTKVFANLGEEDSAVVDVDDPGSARFAEMLEARGVHVARVSRERVFPGGASLVGTTLTLQTARGAVGVADVSELRIRGPHNVSNALAAIAAAHAMGVSAGDIASGLRTFEPIEHRLEPIGEIGGAEWFNDSKATNPDAVIKALRSFDGRPIVLLVGGRNKGSDFGQLALEARDAVRVVVTFGEAGAELAAAFADEGIPVIESGALGDAVLAAHEVAEKGEAVVLSPACASFDEFDNYEQRGRAFKQSARALLQAEST